MQWEAVLLSKGVTWLMRLKDVSEDSIWNPVLTWPLKLYSRRPCSPVFIECCPHQVIVCLSIPNSCYLPLTSSATTSTSELLTWHGQLQGTLGSSSRPGATLWEDSSMVVNFSDHSFYLSSSYHTYTCLGLQSRRRSWRERQEPGCGGQLWAWGTWSLSCKNRKAALIVALAVACAWNAHIAWGHLQAPSHPLSLAWLSPLLGSLPRQQKALNHFTYCV